MFASLGLVASAAVPFYFALKLAPFFNTRILGGSATAILAVLLAFVGTRQFAEVDASAGRLLMACAAAFLNLGASVFLVSLPFFAVFVGASAIDALLKQQAKVSSFVYQDEASPPLQLIFMGYCIASLNDEFVYELFRLGIDAVRDSHGAVLDHGPSSWSMPRLSNIEGSLVSTLRQAATLALPLCVAIASIEIALGQIDQQSNLFRLSELAAGVQLLILLLFIHVVLQSRWLYWIGR
ncbi:hypothetical protein [Variovorax sp.]|uniref:hypothetical protein n=1 Tax=Variovorax sp. TaxID=1871043 RepID=UPI002D52AD69|nr:hypothetical protein [Variovorax sp.]HYP82982.1 hypothetical protein [Variovorax sp.]